MEFSRQEYCSGLPFPSPGVFPSREDLPYLGLKPGLLHCRQILYHLSHWSLLNVLILAFPPFCFWDLYHYFGASLLSFLWILFQVDCLFPLCLVSLVGLYLAPSSATYSSVVSFLSNLLCLWSSFHRLQGYSSSSGVCPWWVRLVQGCVNSWWKRLGPALWWVELSFVPLVGRAIFQGMCFVESVSLVWL